MAVPYVLITDTFTTHVNRTNLLIDAVEGALSNTSNIGNIAVSAFTTTNAAYDQANAAYGRANTVGGAAFDQANTAYGQANTAYDQANTAEDIAIAAYGAANSVAGIAESFDTANAAYGQANAAYGRANTVGGAAFDQANTAYGQANTAYVHANNAYNRANTVGGAAFARANASLSTSSGGTVTGTTNFAAAVDINSATLSINYLGRFLSNGNATFSNATVFNCGVFLNDAYASAVHETPNTINCMTGNYFTRNITNNQTITFISPPNTGNAYSMILRLANAGSFTITWANTPKWPGGTAPTLTGVYGNTDILVFITEDGGAIWRGNLVQKDSR